MKTFSVMVDFKPQCRWCLNPPFPNWPLIPLLNLSLFLSRWNTLSWPKKIIDQIEQTKLQLTLDQDKYHKKLLDDQLQLDDKLDSLQMIVAGFTGRTDLGKAAEIANEVRRVMKDLKDCNAQALLYNQRERLFELPITKVEP